MQDLRQIEGDLKRKMRAKDEELRTDRTGVYFTVHEDSDSSKATKYLAADCVWRKR